MGRKDRGGKDGQNGSLEVCLHATMDNSEITANHFTLTTATRLHAEGRKLLLNPNLQHPREGAG